MKRILVIITLVIFLTSCTTDGQTKGSLNNDYPTDLISSSENTLTSLYQNTVSGVVAIYAQIDTPTGTQPGLGSGFVWDDKGNIVTNTHVVKNGKEITVKFPDGSEMEAQIIAYDIYSDLAVLSVNYPDEYIINPIKLGNSKHVEVGQSAIAIGNPYGESFTLTKGIVSGIGRTRPDLQTNFQIGSVIQHDAAVNPGNSGGPLLNIKGEVIGINAQIISQTGINSGINFAIPINTARKVIPSLIKNKLYEHPMLGIEVDDIDLSFVKSKGLPALTKGVLVGSIMKDAPVSKSKLKKGDIITELNDIHINSVSELVNYLTESTNPKDVVKLTVFRDNAKLNIEVELGARPLIY